jgi:hypothetical protein
VQPGREFLSVDEWLVQQSLFLWWRLLRGDELLYNVHVEYLPRGSVR